MSIPINEQLTTSTSLFHGWNTQRTRGAGSQFQDVIESDKRNRLHTIDFSLEARTWLSGGISIVAHSGGGGGTRLEATEPASQRKSEALRLSFGPLPIL